MELMGENAVSEQYKTADKLTTRISLHNKYSTSPQGFGNWITAHYQIPQGAAILEVGCGTGEMWIGKTDLIYSCSRLILSDASEGMLEMARGNLHAYSGISFRQIDIQSIPYADNTFDGVIANMMLYHVPNIDMALSEVKRVLKKDGMFYCATYGEHGIMEYLCGLFSEYGIQDLSNYSFTLQNGAALLSNYFSDVRRLDYPDSLAITDIRDLVAYILSLSGMTALRNLPREQLLSVLNRHKDIDGVLHVPKEYGMFICH